MTTRRVTGYRSELRRRIAAHRKQKAEEVAITDYMTCADAAAVALPVLFEDQFLGLENESDKMAIAGELGSEQQALALQLRVLREGQIRRTVKWLHDVDLVEPNGLVRKSRLDEALGRYGRSREAPGKERALATLADKSEKRGLANEVGRVRQAGIGATKPLWNKRAGRPGPRPAVRAATADKMVAELRSGARTVTDLKADTLHALVSAYGSSPNTAKAARSDAVTQFQNSETLKDSER